MILGVQGTKSFSQYDSVFLRGMGRALSMISEGEDSFIVYSAGPANINSMVTEFVNITERSLKARGVKSRVHKVPPGWLAENITDVDLFLYFCVPKESYSKVYDMAVKKDVEAEIYRF